MATKYHKNFLLLSTYTVYACPHCDNHVTHQTQAMKNAEHLILKSTFSCNTTTMKNSAKYNVDAIHNAGDNVQIP